MNSRNFPQNVYTFTLPSYGKHCFIEELPKYGQKTPIYNEKSMNCLNYGATLITYSGQ